MGRPQKQRTAHVIGRVPPELEGQTDSREARGAGPVEAINSFNADDKCFRLASGLSNQ